LLQTGRATAYLHAAPNLRPGSYEVDRNQGSVAGALGLRVGKDAANRVWVFRYKGHLFGTQCVLRLSGFFTSSKGTPSVLKIYN
jgi:hypothetical protein